MHPFFNVTSAGATATVWLTQVLNSHPQIAAFHALRSDPFVSKGKDISFDEIFSGIQILKERMYGISSIGLVHSFYNSHFREKLKKMHGGHIAILRDPIRRIHSLFFHHYECTHNVEIIDNDPYLTLRKYNHISELSNPSEVLQRNLNKYEAEFFVLCNVTIKNDILNVIQCQPEEICIFEDFVKDKDYFCGSMEQLTGIEDPSFFEHKFDENKNKKINQHASKKVDSFSIFESWPLELKNILLCIILLHGVDNVLDLYSSHGYSKTIQMVLEWYYETYPNLTSETFLQANRVQEVFSLELQQISVRSTLKQRKNSMKQALDVVRKQKREQEKGTLSLPYNTKQYRRALVVANPVLRSLN